MQDVEVIIAQLREQNRQLLEQNQTLAAQNQSLAQSITEASAQNQLLTQSIADVSTQNQSITQQNQSLNQSLAELTAQVVRLAEQMQRVTDAADSADPLAAVRQQNQQLFLRNQQLLEEVRTLTGQVRVLAEQLEQAQKVAARQAGPFRRPERLKKPADQHKKPGRPAGHVGACRAKPDVIDHHVDVPLSCCPRCGGDIHGVVGVEQIIEEIPPVRPVVYKIVTYRATCACCGDVCSRHPLQTSDATGAAGVHLGPRAAAVAAVLNKHHGLTMRRTCAVLRELTGLRLTPGGLSQRIDRLADRVNDDYESLVNQIRGSPVVYADETSWWVGGLGGWLWTFTCPDATVYRVENRRSAAVVVETLGEDFAGVLVSDCLSSYDPAKYRKHKCIAHHLRAIDAALRLADAKDSAYINEWKLLLKAVIVLHRLWRKNVLDDADVATKRQVLEATIKRLLNQKVRSTTATNSIASSGIADGAAVGTPLSPSERRIQNRLAKQRRHLLGCLKDVRVDPTNNAAERSLRPAVISRKLSCGNKTTRGRRTWETLASLAATYAQTGRDILHHLTTRAALIHA